MSPPWQQCLSWGVSHFTSSKTHHAMWRGSNILNNNPHVAINPMRNVPDSAIQFLSRTSNNNLFLADFSIFRILRKSHSFPLRLHLWIAWPRWGSLPSACHPKRPPRRAKTNGPRWDHTVWSSPAPARIGSDFVPPKPRGPKSQQRSWWRKTLWLYMENGPCTDDLWWSIVMKIMIFHSYVMTGGWLVFH